MADVLQLFPAGDPGWSELCYLELDLMERLQRDLHGLTRHVRDGHPAEAAIVLLQGFVRRKRVEIERTRRRPPI
jgi:hypothetical protein